MRPTSSSSPLSIPSANPNHAPACSLPRRHLRSPSRQSHRLLPLPIGAQQEERWISSALLSSRRLAPSFVERRGALLGACPAGAHVYLAYALPTGAATGCARASAGSRRGSTASGGWAPRRGRRIRWLRVRVRRIWYLSSAPSPLRARTRRQRSAAEQKPGSSAAGANGPYGLFSAADLSGAFGFADGRLVIDFIAQEFGLPLLPPSKANNASFAQGANFAITGATALDTEFFEKRGLGKSVRNSGSLFTQIQWLRDLKPSFCNSTQECKDFFAKSLFVVGELGGNDYNAPLFAGKDLREAYNLMPHVVQGISDGVETLNGSIHNHLWHQSPNLVHGIPRSPRQSSRSRQSMQRRVPRLRPI